MKRIFAALLLLPALACTTPQSVPVAQNQFIMYGTADTTAAHQAVVYLTMGYGACSGTLIARDVVLTAAHCCTASASTMRVYIGNSTNSFTSELGVSVVQTHPNWDPNFEQTNNLANDICLLRLSSNAPVAVTPIPTLPSSLALTAGEVNSLPLQFVGFGLTETGASGTKLKMTQTLANICEGSSWCNVNIPNVGTTQVPPNTIGIQMNTNGGICSGDSGGPGFVTRGGVEYVAGISSFVMQNSSQQCDYFGAATKVDRFASFIADFLGNATENCSNGTDDDDDGQIDCADPDCVADPACGETSCELATQIACGASVSGTTLGAASSYTNYGNNCTGGYPMNGAENVVRVNAGAGTVVTARLTIANASTDLDLLLVKGACDPGNCITGSLNAPGTAETLTFTMDGTDHYLFIETYQNAGQYTLQITCENEQPVPEVCGNGVDDDGDGRVDCDDTDCNGEPGCGPPVEDCDNGLDDDGDDAADCGDADCFGELACEIADEDCGDGIDNDYDGFVDCADVDCKSDSVCDEVLLEICDNGADDDGDGRTDCADPLCRSATQCHPGLEICNNNRDDDGDGRVDCEDADCQTFADCPDPAENCDNGVDDSGDLNIDCEDPKCASFTPCLLQSPWTKTYDTDGCTCRTGAGSDRPATGLMLLGLLLGLFGLFRRFRQV
ncbi:trypsin-like serine protease [Myxococcota bacterium]|nr:trypsin-like serine protease [Myxococcota bacterium]